MVYRILSLDGGGVRGVFTITLLERLQQIPELAAFIQQADLIAGTSAGGILALGLAAGKSPTELRQFYEHSAASIFAVPPPFNWPIVRDLTLLRHFSTALYHNQHLKDALTSALGNPDLRLRDLSKRVLIAAYDLNHPLVGHWRAKFFHNFPPHPFQSSDGDERVVDVALRTSAAPTFFPFYERFVDGGVAANNPAMCALAQAVNPETGRQDLSDVVILSVGSGEVKWRIAEPNATWGVWRWMTNQPRLTDLLVEGNVDVALYQSRQMLRQHLHRLNPVLPYNIALDDAASVPRLVQFAQAALLEDDSVKGRPPMPTEQWLKDHWLEGTAVPT